MISPRLGHGNNISPVGLWVPDVNHSVKPLADRLVSIDRLPSTDEPVYLVDGILVAVNGVYRQRYFPTQVTISGFDRLVEEYTIGGAAATRGQDRLLVSKAMDLIDNETFADGELPVNNNQ